MNVVSFGGGTNSTAMIIGMYLHKIPIDLILFADTGGEQPHTYEFMETFNEWLVKHGIPKIVSVEYHDKDGNRLTLEQECINSGRLPSIAYRVYSPDGKSVTLCGNGGGVGAKTGLYAVPVPVNETVEGKAQCLRATYYKDGIRNMVGNTVDRKTCVAMPVGMAAGPKSILVVTDAGKSVPVYEVRNGKIAIKGKEYPIKLTDGFYIIRKLTVTECKRLQTVPDTYTFPVSDTQAYKMLGNGWTVDVIAHIMSHFDGLTEEPVEVLSMYDGMSCGHIALDKLGVDVTAYYATEIDKYAIQTTQHNFPDTVQLGDAFQVRDEEWRPRRAEEAE